MPLRERRAQEVLMGFRAAHLVGKLPVVATEN
jgi:hypothetical protein